MIVGVGASRVRDLFAQAKEAAPAIVAAASMMLDKVRAGELGTAPDDTAADSIRNGWL